MSLESEFLIGVSVQTLRNVSRTKKTTETLKIENIKGSPLFNIDQFHSYNLGIKNVTGTKTLNTETEAPKKLTVIADIKPENYIQSVKKVIKIGTMTLVKNIQLFEPKNGNGVKSNWNLIDILNLECPPSWRLPFELAYKELIYLNETLADEEQKGLVLCPHKQHWFRAFELCPLNNLKVVIVGQDPYHTIRNGHPVANGLAFSTNKGLRIQPSLRNIYKELERTIPGFEVPEHGDLSRWAKQGVLLLNTALTTIKNKAGAHTVFWSGFTTHIINVINKVKPECVYMLWGVPAGKMKKYIHNTKYVLQSNHPSPMVRNSNFKGNNHFLQANELLKSIGKKGINWKLD